MKTLAHRRWDSNRIPVRYAPGMTTQISIRLPDDLVTFLDAEVAGGADSRAAIVVAALRHELRRRAELRDITILKNTAAAIDDLDGLAEHAATVDFTDLD
jgi:antitoxin MazE3